MDLYAEHILEHYRHPQGKGQLVEPSVVHREVNWSCGDDLTIELLVHDGCVQAVAWQGAGCAISQAAMSMLQVRLVGRTLEDIRRLSPADVYALLGVPVGVRRQKCALLCLLTVQNALRVVRGESPVPWEVLLTSSGQGSLPDAD
jgi:nitrogen fixation protein NifU and related proteins